MPTTYPGIHNENEFYSHHYLAEVFAGDIKETLSRWRKTASEDETAPQTPDRALRSLSRPYRTFRQQFAPERRNPNRIALQRDWFRQLLTALGYPFEPTNHTPTGDDEDEIPILHAAGPHHGTPKPPHPRRLRPRRRRRRPALPPPPTPTNTTAKSPHPKPCSKNRGKTSSPAASSPPTIRRAGCSSSPPANSSSSNAASGPKAACSASCSKTSSAAMKTPPCKPPLPSSTAIACSPPKA